MPPARYIPTDNEKAHIERVTSWTRSGTPRGGGEALTVTDLCDRIGISRPAFYALIEKDEDGQYKDHGCLLRTWYGYLEEVPGLSKVKRRGLPSLSKQEALHVLECHVTDSQFSAICSIVDIG